MSPDFFPGCGNRCSHSASILTCVFTTRPSRTCFRGVGMSHKPLLKAKTHHRHIVPNICSNPLICPSSVQLVFNTTPFKWLKLFNRSNLGLLVAGHGCTLACMLQTLFASQSITVTAYRVRTDGANAGHLSAN